MLFNRIFFDLWIYFKSIIKEYEIILDLVIIYLINYVYGKE